MPSIQRRTPADQRRQRQGAATAELQEGELMSWIEIRPPAYANKTPLRIRLSSAIVSRIAVLPADDWIGPMVEAVAVFAAHSLDELIKRLRTCGPHAVAVFTVGVGASEARQSTRNLGAAARQIM